MRLLLSSALLGLAWFGAINIAVSIAAALAGRTALARGVRSAQTVLAIRLLPVVSSTFFAFAIFLPAHWQFEQRDAQESFGVVLGALAAVGAAILLRAVHRAVRAASRGHRLLRAARSSGTALEDGALAVDGWQGISLAGILRPRILVGADALRVLTATELDVAISHETAHRRSRDNLKRFLMFCSPDVLGLLPIARQLEKRWEAEAECLADARAVHGDERRAVALASALVKVATLNNGGGTTVPAPAWSAFHVPTLLELRVRRLVAGRALDSCSSRGVRTVVVAALLAAPICWLSDLSLALHLVTEAMVTHLP